MNKTSRFKILAVVVLSTTYSAMSFGQAAVVEAGQSNTYNNGQNASNDNSVVMNLYLQLEALQQEVQTLRGVIEEQSYSIKRMQAEQRDRYLDLDRRLSANSTSQSTTSLVPSPRNNQIPAVSSNSSSAVQANNSQASTVASTIASRPQPTIISPNTTANTQTLSEQETYRTALNLLLEENQYVASIDMFQRYIDTYTNGRYLTNAYYWQGEAFILTENFPSAKQVFVQVIEQFPQDPKAPGAMLKLGVAYNQMGQTDLALQVWQKISTDYPESLTEIRAAEDYLRRSGN